MMLVAADRIRAVPVASAVSRIAASRIDVECSRTLSMLIMKSEPLGGEVLRLDLRPHIHRASTANTVTTAISARAA